MGVIYFRKNIINGMMYVGKTTNIKQRNRQWRHLKQQYANKLLEEDRAKYGVENFDTTILKEVDNSELDKWEKYFIEKLNTIYPNGYNFNDGGSIGFHMLDETKRKISESNKGVEKSTEHLIDFQFEKGHEPWNKGKTGCFSEETIKKMSNSATGRKRTEDSRKKQSERIKGKWLNREGTSKKVAQIDPKTGKIVAIYPSRNEAGRAIGVRGTNIGNCCRGGYFSKGKWVNVYTVKGYIFKYMM